MKAEDIAKLSLPFPRDAVSWRAQTLSREGTKALALAYIDARDVMDRLDEVCGPANWQDRYEFHGPRTICYLSIRIDGEWITKADGAGDSDVEAEKGAISDALKRSAVKWGIARYLYNMPNVWAQCESYEKGGKKHWSKWIGDPWDAVRNAPDRQQSQAKSQDSAATSHKPVQPPKNEKARETFAALQSDMRQCKTQDDLGRWWRDEECKALRATLPTDWQANLKSQLVELGDTLPAVPGDTVSAIQEQFPGSTVTDERITNETGRELHPMEAAE